MNDGATAKQQIVERIKESSNILVTVSTDPSVDELSAALGLTLMLNNLKKHATAVVSGEIPPAITFLDPEKTFENTVDSLRDFIIALDKEKADHLRYKVDGDVVKIFITPYRTTISEKDLDFSQGDYNVELVLALGVQNKDHLDKALESHGRILHDATVATVSCGSNPSELGSIDWFESGASSISEMLVSLSEALKGDKPILDDQISTAFLTGIVASTDRFSNDKTSSKVMTMAAQLMAAGANQQLIASKLGEAHEITSEDKSSESSSSSEPQNSDGTTDLAEDTSTKVERKASKEDKESKDSAIEEKSDDGSLSISHENGGDLDAVAKEVQQENTEAAAEKAEDALASQLGTVTPAAGTPSVADLQKDIAAANAEVDEAANEAAAQPASLSTLEMPDYEPTLGGTLNATTQQAAEDKRREEENDQNKKILSHARGTLTGNTAPVFASAPFSASVQPAEAPESDNDQPVAPVLPPLSPPASPDPPPPEPPTTDQQSPQTLADLDQATRIPHEEARAAVDAALNNTPFNPANHPVASVGAQPLGGELHQDQSQSQSAQPANSLPPLPDFPLPPPPPPPASPFMPLTPPAGQPQPEQLGQIFGDTPTPPSAEVPNQPADPNQFKIPGQG